MKILIVDDEPVQCDLLKGFLEKQGYELACAHTGMAALDLFQTRPFQLVILDHRMPEMTGDELLEKIKAIHPLIHAIMITAYGNVDTAVKVLKLGADDFLEKPVDLMMLLTKIRAIEQEVMVTVDVESVVQEIEKQALPLHLVGNSSGMREVLSLVRRVSPTPWNVLIHGESGTGKELIARLIHMMGPTVNGPLIVVNCGAIPENLFESELFGHEKGAFTGAATRRLGRFELAKGGTLFLDEIGELPLRLQPKLLRALQEKRITRVGGETEIDVDVRVLAATNRDLQQMIGEGAFREDLFYRLNVFGIDLPSLRHRKEDIPELVEFFLTRYRLRPIQFHPDALSLIMKYPFPGNVRELEHMVQRTVTLARGAVITDRDLPPEIRFHQVTNSGNLAERLEAVEREMLLSALEKNGWIQTRAAESLGISERVLRYKIRKHDITRTA
ncbi:MAG: sigma-54 dependent transcriptional regulator [Pseudomonadota bacterium]